MNSDEQQQRRKLEEEALHAAFDLAMKVRSYVTALDPYDSMLRAWVLHQIEQELPQLASQVITRITKIEDIDHFEAYGEPRL
jgi:hypothetical protein